MAAWNVWLRSLGSAIWQEAPQAILGLIPFGENVGRIAERFWGNLRDAQPPGEDKAALEQLVNVAPEELAAAAANVAEQVAPEAPPETRRTLALTLTMAGPVSRRALTRADDPGGKTVPAALSLTGPLVIGRFIPPGPPRFREGQTFRDWVMKERLGVGGFAEVWRIQHPHDDNLEAAVKFLLGDEARRRLGEHEVAVLKQVRRLGAGTGVVSLVDFNVQADPPWLQFEYVAGGDLVRHVSRFAGAASTALIGELAGIVGRCHRLTPPVVHRDLKPGNVLMRVVDGGLRPVVADFGIGGISSALELGQEKAARPTGALPTELVGAHTALYASPQQMAGSPPDPRDDVFALGVMWYQLAIGDLTSPAPSGLGWADDLKEAGFTDALVRVLGACVEPRKVERRPRDAADLAERIAASMNTPAKASKAKPAPVAVVEDGEPKARTRTTGESGKTVAERRLILVQAMRKLGATSATSAKTKKELAENTGLTEFDVYGLLYHANLLQTEGFAAQVSKEGVRGLSYHLTPKGVKATDEELSAKGA